MIELVSIENTNRHLVSEFLEQAGQSLDSFRYFKTRPLSVLDNHLVTSILKVNNQSIGYGHLDKEDNKVWLGIAIASTYKGKGLGKIMMMNLIASAKLLGLNEIFLSVDKDNKRAIKLYEKNNFKNIKEGASNLFFKLDLI